MASRLADSKRILTATTTQLKTGKGILHRVIVAEVGTTWKAAIYADVGATSDPIAFITATNALSIDIGVKFQEGLYVVTTGTPGEFVFVFE